ncbi:MAG: hydrogenase maturation nickel metallochaperone HypA [Gammaproteobacteria bacterium]|nr:hydrogenase maturation nickel metallochaperone HypA [Gammaproteobacteria bacterium]
MHELSICQALISQADDIARRHRATAIRTIKLSIGPLSGVEPDLLRQAFPLASAGSVAQYSRLIIERLPIRVHCETCGAETPAKLNRLVCGECGDWHTRLLSGDELLLDSVELAETEDSHV